MRTYFDTTEIAHVWANKSAERGRCPASMSFSGDVIYSYAAEIARHIVRNGQSAVIFNVSSYSNTTSRHQGLIRSSIASGIPVFEYYGTTNATGTQLFERALKSVAEWEIDAAKRREGTQVKSRAIYEAARHMRMADEISRFFGLRRKASARAIKRIQEQERAAEAIRLKAEEKRRKQEEKRERIDLEAWVAGKSIHRYFSNSPVRLRVETGEDGKQIATSRGARFPYDDGKRTFAFLQRVRESGWHRNGTTFQIGGYQLDAVSSDGVVAGCHRVKWDEIERFAKAEGWL